LSAFSETGFGQMLTSVNPLMRSLRNFLLFYVCAAVLAGCQTSTPPRLALDEARKLATKFKVFELKQLPRTISSYRSMNNGSLRSFSENCPVDRMKRDTEIRSLVADTQSGSNAERQNAAARLTSYLEQEFKYGNFKFAIKVSQDSVKNLQQSNSVRKAVLMTQLGRMQANAGENSAAISSFAGASQLWNLVGPKYSGSYQGKMMIDAANASRARMRGDLLSEEFLLRKVWKKLKHGIGISAFWAMDSDEILSRIASNLMMQGRYIEAELLVKDLATPNTQDTPLSVLAFAEILYAQGRYDDAVFIAKQAINIHYSECSHPDGIPFVEAWRTLLKSLSGQEKWSEIQDLKLLLRRDFKGYETRYNDLFGANVDLLLTRAFVGGDASLLQDVDDAIAMRADLSGQDTQAVNELKLIKGLALHNLGQADRAMTALKGVMLPYLSEAYTQGGAIKSGGHEGRAEFFREAYMDFLSSSDGRSAASALGIDAGEELFQVANMISSGRVQKAFAASAARAAAKDPELAELVRQTQDINENVLNLTDWIVYLQTAPKDQVNGNGIDELRKQLDTLNDAKRVLVDETNSRFPIYAKLMNPPPPTVDSLQKNLRPGEAALITHSARDRTYVWAVPKIGQVVFASVDMGREPLKKVVDELRLALDPREVSNLGDIPDFDIEKANGLYKQLLEPVQSGWKDARNLLVVAHGPLGHLPFSLLVKERVRLPASGDLLFANYRDVPWLAKSHAVTMLPSVESLETLRATEVSSPERKPFVGFGDPYFNALQAEEGDEEDAIQVASLTGTRSIPQVKLRSAPNTRAADSATLSLLPRLPDTRPEIMAIAEVTGADLTQDVFLGRDASEQNAKTKDLSQYKVISFATHGLIPGDLNGLNQPALALSSPEVTGEDDDDGLLTMGEVLGLKLNADWVVLSACNTAAGEGQGAEAVSGIGRAFFYAGSRSLLVSNWPVHSAATTELMMTLFSKQANDNSINRTEALRQARIELIDNRTFKNPDGKEAYSYAHPIFWAPFTIVGDGGL
jgi:CHAT domain-containing protein